MRIHGAGLPRAGSRLLALGWRLRLLCLKSAAWQRDSATSQFNQMKMQPSPDRALRHKEMLGA